MYSFTADIAHPKGDIDQDARYQVLLIIPHRFSAFNVAEVRPAPLLLLLPKRGSLLTYYRSIPLLCEYLQTIRQDIEVSA